MMNNTLTHHHQPTAPYFTDNMMMHDSQPCLPDGHITRNQVDVDFSKGIYNLRPRSGHIGPTSLKADHDELNTLVKQKRPRNSLKKRLLVNARERERMRVLNSAFQALRDALPCYIADGHMAKITTLRLAINYIKALTEVLNDGSSAQMQQNPIVCQALASSAPLMIPSSSTSVNHPPF